MRGWPLSACSPHSPSGRPELAILASPFALILFAGLAASREPEILVWLELDRERAVEGDIVTITIDLRARTPVERLELHVPLPETFELIEGVTPLTLRLALGRGADDRAEGSLHAVGRVHRR